MLYEGISSKLETPCIRLVCTKVLADTFGKWVALCECLSPILWIPEYSVIRTVQRG